MFNFLQVFKKRVFRVQTSEIEFQEVLLDSLAQKKEIELGLPSQKIEFPIASSQLLFFRVIFFLSFFILFSRTFQLIIIDGKNYASLSEHNYLITKSIVPDRGVIYDRNFTQLVFNKSSFDLFLDKRKLPNTKQERWNIASTLADILSGDPNAIFQKIENEESAWQLISENLEHETILRIQEEQKRGNLPGVILYPNIVREYQDGPIFAHLLGYTSKVNKEEVKTLANYTVADTIGRAGLEKAYEQILRGEPKFIEVPRDVLGDGFGNVSNLEPGKSLVLWIDSGLQKKLTEALQKTMVQVGSEKAAAVALDPRSGAVLALASLPSFNNNLFSQGISKEEFQQIQEDSSKPMFSRAISGMYLPGSTIKPFIAAAGLQEGIISEKTRLFAPLELCLKNIYSGERECYEDWTFHGWTDVKRAIAESINPFFYIIGGGYKKNEFSDSLLPDRFQGLGIAKIAEYLSLFGFGKTTGIDLPGEATGRVPDADWKKNYFSNPSEQVWYLGDTYNLSIGQGYLLVTPLQVATAFGAIANGGKLYQPQVVWKIVDSERNVVQEFPPKVLAENFINQDYLRIVRDGMRDAVRYGSAVFLSGLPVEAAAKTGTAQISANSDLYYNWITVFAPYEEPEIVLTVVFEDVKGIRAAALLVAKETLEWYFSGH